MIKPILVIARVKANIAGKNHQFALLLSIPQTENAAPVTGPIMKPIAKAIPTSAFGKKEINACIIWENKNIKF